jgi:hypothetical protein
MSTVLMHCEAERWPDYMMLEDTHVQIMNKINTRKIFTGSSVPLGALHSCMYVRLYGLDA